MRKNKMARSAKKQTKGTLPKRKPVDPKVRAKKRLEQALRRRIWDDSPSNEARIKRLKAGTWPLPTLLTADAANALQGTVAECASGCGCGDEKDALHEGSCVVVVEVAA